MSTKTTASRVRRKGHKRTAPDQSSTLLKLIHEGVKRFVLHGAPISIFQKAVRKASRAGEFSSHPLTGPEFRRIVKEAVTQRKRLLAGQRANGKRIQRKGPPS